MRDKSIGIGISCFNRLSNVRTILAILRRFNLTEQYSIAFASDGCTDGTQDFLKQQQDIVVVLGENKGVTVNKNRLLKMLKDFEFIFLFEDDILLVKPQLLQYTINIHKKTGLHHFNYGCLATYKPKIYKGIPLYGSGDLNGQFVFITQKVLEKVGYLNPAFKGYGYEHCEWTFRICKAGLYKWVPYYTLYDPKRFFEFLTETGGMPKKAKNRWSEKNSQIFSDFTHKKKFKLYQSEPEEEFQVINKDLLGLIEDA